MERPRHFQCRRPFRRRQCCPTLRTFCRPPRVRSRKIARLCREDNRFVRAPANDRVCVAALVLLSRRPAARALPVLKSRGKNPATVHRKMSMLGSCAKQALIREADGIKLSPSDLPSIRRLINVRLGGITRVAANRAKSRAAAAFRFRAVDPFECDFDQERDRSQSADRHQRNGSGLAHWAFDFIGDEHSDSKPKCGACEREQIIQRNLVARFWNGYREGHRLLISPVGEKETGKSARWRDLRYWQLLTCLIRSMPSSSAAAAASVSGR